MVLWDLPKTFDEIIESEKILQKKKKTIYNRFKIFSKVYI